MHKIESSVRTPSRRGPGYPDRLTVTCTCGTTASSTSGADGTFRAFDKHVQRATAADAARAAARVSA